MSGDFKVIREFNKGDSSVKKSLIEFNGKTCLLREYDRRFMIDRYRSFDNMIRLHNAGINVPELYKFGEGYSIVEWIEGYPLDKLLTNTPSDKKYSKAVSKELVKMHSVKPHEELNIYLKYLNSYNKKIKRINDLGIDIDLSMIVDYVSNNVEVLRGMSTSIVHGDFHPGNIIMNGDKPYMIDLDVCKENNGIYDLASSSVIENYPAFYYTLINNYFDGKVPGYFWKVYNLYSILYILDYIFYTYRMGKSMEDAQYKLDYFLGNNRCFKDEKPYWYTLRKKGEK